MENTFSGRCGERPARSRRLRIVGAILCFSRLATRSTQAFNLACGVRQHRQRSSSCRGQVEGRVPRGHAHSGARIAMSVGNGPHQALHQAAASALAALQVPSNRGSPLPSQITASVVMCCMSSSYCCTRVQRSAPAAAYCFALTIAWTGITIHRPFLCQDADRVCACSGSVS